MIRRLVIFVACTLALWALAALPLWYLAQERAHTAEQAASQDHGELVPYLLASAQKTRESARAQAILAYSATALGLCLLPTVLTLLWGLLAFKQSPENQLAMVMGGTGLRMFTVLFGAWFLYDSVPFYRAQSGFWTWILVFYLATLALEMTVLLARREPASATEEASPARPFASPEVTRTVAE